MKKHTLFPRRPIVSGLAAAFLTVAFSAGTALSQVPAYPADDTDIPLETTYNGATLSTAMIERVESEQPVSVIAYSAFNKMGFFVQYEDAMDHFDAFEDTRWSAVDVAIADDLNALGEYYYVAVTYKELDALASTYDLKLKLFRVRVASGSIAIQGGAPVDSLNLGTISLIAGITGNLRVDAAASLTDNYGPDIPVIDRFVVLYQDATSTRIRELASDLSWQEDYYVSSNILVGKDIATSVNRDNGTTEAIIGCVVGNDLYYMEYVLGPPGFLNVIGGPLAGNVYTWSSPRIEAFGLYDFSGSSAKWAMVADIGLMHDSIMLFSDINAGQLANPTMGNFQEYPTIAAGIGPLVPSRADKFGNTQYSFAWGNTLYPSTYGGNYFANYLDQWGVLVDPMNCYYVNNTPGPLALTSDPADWISMSNSCNSGLGSVTAWNDGQWIMYKINIDPNYKFRPQDKDKTGIPDAIVLPTAIYPNPAKDHFTVEQVKPGTQLELVNSLGQVVHRETITSEKAKVEVSGLSEGTYYIHFTGSQGNPVKQKLVLLH